MRKLNPRQIRFVEEYLVDLNATQAATRAEYSEKTAYQIGSRLLKDPRIQALIAVQQAERSERTEITKDYVLTNSREVLERCMERAPVMVRRDRRMVQQVDDEGRHVWQFDAKGAIGALTLMAKHLGMLTEKHEHTGKDGGPVKVTVTHRVIRVGDPH